MTAPIPDGPIEVRPETPPISPSAPPGTMAGNNKAILLGALVHAGITLGAYDHRIVTWLAGWEPETAVVIASWMQRAAGGTS